MPFQPDLLLNSRSARISPIPDVTDAAAGLMTPEMKAKIDAVPEGAVLAGDAVGPMGSNSVVRAQGIPLDLAGHTADQVLALDPTNTKIVPRTVADGKNAFTATTADFTQPAVGGSAVADVLDSTWAAVGQVVFAESGGYYLLTSKPTATQMQLQNLGYDGNAAPGATVPAASPVSPGGLKGTDAPYESSFGQLSVTVSPALQVYLGVNGTISGAFPFPASNNIDGRISMNTQAIQINRIDFAFGSPIPLGITISLEVSTDGGTSYSSATGVPLAPGVKFGSSLISEVLPPGSMHIIQLRGNAAVAPSYIGPVSISVAP